jgi:hypothetical protein
MRKPCPPLNRPLTRLYRRGPSIGGMGPRRIWVGVGLALAGLAAAVAIGLLANSISGDSVGLSAEPLSAGDALAPPAAERTERRRERRARRPTRSRTAPTRTSPPATETAPPAADDDAAPEIEDDGRGRGRGRSGGDSGSGSDDSGFDDSGSGSDDSGSGSDDSGSGSDDSGSSGHGSDD